jgi:hypothetical protein
MGQYRGIAAILIGPEFVPGQAVGEEAPAFRNTGARDSALLGGDPPGRLFLFDGLVDFASDMDQRTVEGGGDHRPRWIEIDDPLLCLDDIAVFFEGHANGVENAAADLVIVEGEIVRMHEEIIG